MGWGLGDPYVRRRGSWGVRHAENEVVRDVEGAQLAGRTASVDWQLEGGADPWRRALHLGGGG